MAIRSVTVINQHGLPVGWKLKQAVLKRTVYWSDDRLCHWFFDFKHNNKWISSIEIKNDFSQIKVEVF